MILAGLVALVAWLLTLAFAGPGTPSGLASRSPVTAAEKKNLWDQFTRVPPRAIPGLSKYPDPNSKDVVFGRNAGGRVCADFWAELDRNALGSPVPGRTSKIVLPWRVEFVESPSANWYEQLLPMKRYDAFRSGFNSDQTGAFAKKVLANQGKTSPVDFLQEAGYVAIGARMAKSGLSPDDKKVVVQVLTLGASVARSRNEHGQAERFEDTARSLSTSK